MAYDFVAASTQYISSSAPVTAVPLTMFVKVKRATNNTSDYFLALTRASVGDQMFLLYDGRVNYAFFVQNGGSYSQALTSGSSTNVWQNVTGVSSSVTSRFVFLDDSKSLVQTGNIAPSQIDTLAIGTGVLSNVATNPANGQLAEAALWSVDLTDAEIASLTKGFKPYRIRPQSLVFYAPLVRNLQDVKAGRALTNNNTATVAVHPRVI